MWYCLQCGDTTTWNDPYAHDALPPRYSENLTQEGYPLGTTCWYVYLYQDGLLTFLCAATPQEAICKAALQAVGVAIEE